MSCSPRLLTPIGFSVRDPGQRHVARQSLCLSWENAHGKWNPCCHCGFETWRIHFRRQIVHCRPFSFTLSITYMGHQDQLLKKNVSRCSNINIKSFAARFLCTMRESICAGVDLQCCEHVQACFGRGWLSKHIASRTPWLAHVSHK